MARVRGARTAYMRSTTASGRILELQVGGTPIELHKTAPPTAT